MNVHQLVTADEKKGGVFIALSKAQAEFALVKKDAKNPFFKSNYATLAAYIEASSEILSKNGLCITQTTKMTEHGLMLVTTLGHTTGEFIQGEFPIKPIKEDPQGFGSAMSYARRYSYAAILGLASEDDDGNSASKPEPKTNSHERISEAQAKRLFAIAAETGWQNEEIKELISNYGYDSTKEILKSDYETIIKELQK